MLARPIKAIEEKVMKFNSVLSRLLAFFLSIVTFSIIIYVPTSAANKTMTENDVWKKIEALTELFPHRNSYFTANEKPCTDKDAGSDINYDSDGYSYCVSDNCVNCSLDKILYSNSKAKQAIRDVPALEVLLDQTPNSCCAFARFAFCYIFEHDYLTNSTVISTTNCGITKEFLSILKPGDLVKCYESFTSAKPSHWAIFLGYDSSKGYVYFYESNRLSPNRVEYNSKRYSDGMKLGNNNNKKWVKLVVHRSKNHESKLTVKEGYKVIASDGVLNIRKEADASSAKKGELSTGTVVTVTDYDKHGNWGKINYNGEDGWIDLKYTEKTSDSSNSDNSNSPPLNDIYLISAPDGSQAMRKSSTTSSTKLCDVPNGTFITVTNLANDGKWDWGYTTYNGQTGWVCLYYAVKHTSHSSGTKWLSNDTHHWHTCNCGEIVEKAAHNVKDGTCTVCGKKFYTLGDLDGKSSVTADDAIYLLYNIFFGAETYPVNQACDFNGDRSLTAADAIYLLYHVFFGAETYPLN